MRLVRLTDLNDVSDFWSIRERNLYYVDKSKCSTRHLSPQNRNAVLRVGTRLNGRSLTLSP